MSKTVQISKFPVTQHSLSPCDLAVCRMKLVDLSFIFLNPKAKMRNMVSRNFRELILEKIELLNDEMHRTLT
jgi:hypothetical protein